MTGLLKLAQRMQRASSRFKSTSWRQQAARRASPRAFRQKRGLIPEDSGDYANSLTNPGDPNQRMVASGDGVKHISNLNYAQYLQDDTPHISKQEAAKEWAREVAALLADEDLT